MKGFLFTILLLIISNLSFAQIYWTEDFGTGTGCGQSQLATAYSGVNGNWALSSTGNNGSKSNIWFNSAESTNLGAGACESPCTSSYDYTFHVGNDPNSPAAFLFCPTGDCGAAYDDTDSTAITSRRIESPTINLTGLSGLEMSFHYIMRGQSGFDYGRVWFYDGAIWIADTIPLTTTPCGPQSIWTYLVINIPSFANNNPNFKVGFEWKNNGDGVATDPSFAIDNIRIANNFNSINDLSSTIPFSYNVIDNTVNFNSIDVEDFQIELYDLTGKLVLVKFNQYSIELPSSGIYLIRIWINNQPYLIKVSGV